MVEIGKGGDAKGHKNIWLKQNDKLKSVSVQPVQ